MGIGRIQKPVGIQAVGPPKLDLLKNKGVENRSFCAQSINLGTTGFIIVAILTYFRVFLLSRHRLALEATSLRQQLAVFKRKRLRPKLHRLDRFFWTLLARLYSRWADALILVQPATVVSWHRAEFRLFWRWRSRPSGRPKVTKEIRELIRRMRAKNPAWGAPHPRRVLQLGFEVPNRPSPAISKNSSADGTTAKLNAG